LAARPFASRPSSGGDTAFARRVLAVLRRVPPGRVTTYGTVARLAGKPRAARAVGNILRDARTPGLPYHRVVAAGGALGGYGTSVSFKRALLIAEGLSVGATRVRELQRRDRRIRLGAWTYRLPVRDARGRESINPFTHALV
jgi:O-6-methylguanine DNA methyltransferase